MPSRGIWQYMSARTRRSLVLSWSALFVLSLVLQYFSFAVAQPVLAVHDEGLFELDGNTANEGAAGDDWSNADKLFINDPLDQQTDQIFTGGGSKDDLNIPSWAHTAGSVPDKDNIEHAFASAYESGGDTFVYFGLDRYANNGDSFVGFWFFKSAVGLNGDGSFSGTHQVGDLLVLSNFTNGGAVSTIQLFEWVGSGGDTNGTLDLIASGNACTGSPAIDKACAIANTAEIDPPWTFDDKFAGGADNNIPAGSFFEGGVNLDEVFGGDAPCFSSFLAETRSSQSVDAVLKDFALGSFNTCEPPTIATQVSAAAVDFGQTVTDTATLSGDDGPATGTVTFFVCGPAPANPDCSTGGTQVGGAVAVTPSANGGTAVSAPFEPTVSGKYCFRAVYAPDAASQYLAGSHTNLTTECFELLPATIDIEKIANPAGPVSAGDEIGFDVVVTNTGAGTALNVTVNDPLPAGIDWSAGTPTGSTTGLSCSITGPVGTEVLGCTKPSLAPSASFTVHVSGLTDAADCGTVSNTASVSTSNDGEDSDNDSVVVQCPDVTVDKTPDGGTVNAGGTAVFTITVSNAGPGEAKDVTLTDNLPAGVDWSEDSASCSISGAVGSEVLSCNFGDLAAGASASVNVSGLTDAQDCGTIPNLASVAASNEAGAQTGNNSDEGSIEVLCAEIGIAKVANPAGPVNAGDDIGFDITVTNSGSGSAVDVHVSDPLPAGVDWVLGAITGDTSGVTCQITGAPGSEALTCDDASMASGDSFSVHVSGATDAEDCGVVDNTASVTTGNDGSGEASADVTVNCPDVHVDKTADEGTINSGDTASFTITVTNDGVGTAYDVTLTDTLPAGVVWAENSDACAIAAGVLSCDFGDLASGASASVTVSGATDGEDCGVLDNLATVAASNESAADALDNSDDATITVNCPDVTVLKVGNGTISAGEVASFDITVTNLGPGTAFDVTLTDDLPAGVDWTDDSDLCEIAGGTLTCDFGDLADGASASVTVSGETDAEDCGTLPNTAVVAASNEAQDDTANNESSDTITVDCPEIVITKTADDAVVNAGDQIGFTITVTNTGDGSAFNVTVSDVLPAIAGLSWSIESQTGGWTIDGGTLEFGPATLGSGASTSVHIVSDTTAASCGEVPNLASVTFDGGSGSDDSSVTVLCPDIELVKSASNSPITAGEDAVFAITVTNIGDGAATDVIVTDDLPAGIAWADDSDLCEIAAGTLTCDLGTMDPDESFTVHVSGTTNNASAADNDCGDLPNLAEASASNEAAGDTENNSDDATIEVLCPNLALVKTADESPIQVGEDAVFQLTVSNGGNGVAVDVVLTDNLPAGYDWTDDSDLCEIAAGTLTCDLGDMAPGGTFTVTLTAPTVDEGAGSADCGVIDNAAIVSAINESEDDLEDNTDDASITVECPSALTILKAVTGNSGGIDPILDVPLAEIGDTLTYTLTYTGLGPITNAVITDVLPVGLDYVEGSAAGDANFTFIDYDDATRTLTWTAASLPNPANGSVTYDVDVLEEAPEQVQPLINVATIDSDETEPDDDTQGVAVVAPPLGLTPPPTSTLAPESGTSNAGFALMLVLLGIAGLAIGIGFVTPVPERVRRTDRRR